MKAPYPHSASVPNIKPKEWKQPERAEYTWWFVNRRGWIYGGGR